MIGCEIYINKEDFINLLKADGYNNIDYRSSTNVIAADNKGFMYKIRKRNYLDGKKPHKFMRNPFASQNLCTYFDINFPDYELVSKEYLGIKEDAAFICKRHSDKGIQYRSFDNMIHNNRGCHYCAVERNDKKVSTEEIIKRCDELGLIYVDRYVHDYETYVKYKCSVHENKGIIISSWYHLKTYSVGCPYCTGRYKTTDDFKEEMKYINPNIEIIGEYHGSEKHIECICKICGHKWSPLARSLKSKEGCPNCSISKGELKIKDFLANNNIDFVQQYSFDDCVYHGKLKFDFYIPLINTAIEYDGQQHFFPVDFANKGEEWAKQKFLLNKERDEIKNAYCKNAHINLIRIPYFKFDDIFDILTPVCQEFLLCKNS